MVREVYGLLREYNKCHEPGGKPTGGQFCGTTAAQVEDLIASAPADGYRVLFHSGDASIDEAIQQGLIPQMGEWVEEVLSGATDEQELIDEIRDNEDNHLVFFSTEPSWVSMKVARKLGKGVHDVTVADVLKHGQLSLVTVDPTDDSFWQAGEEQDGTTLDGKVTRRDLPFGVEPGDIFTDQSVVPDLTLTGKELMKFLVRNYPEDLNIVADPENLAPFQSQLRLPFK